MPKSVSIILGGKGIDMIKYLAPIFMNPAVWLALLVTIILLAWNLLLNKKARMIICYLLIIFILGLLLGIVYAFGILHCADHNLFGW